MVNPPALLVWRGSPSQHSHNVHCYVEVWHAVLPFWCFNIRSDLLREISDVWCFGDKSDVDWAVTFVFHISCPFRRKELRFILIIKFLSSIFHPHACLVFVPSWRASLRCLGNNCYAWPTSLTTLSSISDAEVQDQDATHRALLDVGNGNIQLTWNCNVKTWYWKRQQSDVNETDPSGNTGDVLLTCEWSAWESPQNVYNIKYAESPKKNIKYAELRLDWKVRLDSSLFLHYASRGGKTRRISKWWLDPMGQWVVVSTLLNYQWWSWPRDSWTSIH